MVIGRDGQTIRKIQNETGAKVQFNTVDPNVPGDRYVLVQGTREQVRYPLFKHFKSFKSQTEFYILQRSLQALWISSSLIF